MRFVTVRQLRQNSAEVWQELKDGQEVILTSNGKPIAVLAGTDERNVENLLIAFRRAKATIALEEMRRRSMEIGTDKMTLEEINAEIKAARRERKQR